MQHPSLQTTGLRNCYVNMEVYVLMQGSDMSLQCISKVICLPLLCSYSVFH